MVTFYRSVEDSEEVSRLVINFNAGSVTIRLLYNTFCNMQNVLLGQLVLTID